MFFRFCPWHLRLRQMCGIIAIEVNHMKKFFSEFKKFITRGNVVDLAVAVVVGGAFGKITTSLVNDILMPLVSLAVGGVGIGDWKWVITPAVYDSNGTLITAESALYYGNFIQTVINFIIISLVVFVIVKLFNKANGGLNEMADIAKAITLSERRRLRKEGKSNKEIRLIAQQRIKEAREKEEELKKANAKPTTEQLLTEIRDLLKENK